MKVKVFAMIEGSEFALTEGVDGEHHTRSTLRGRDKNNSSVT